jgi:putative glycerol-1-phosphate prenyltransferase
MTDHIYKTLLHKKATGRKSFAVLIDPDKTGHLDALLRDCNTHQVDYIFIGGSLLTEGELAACIRKIKTQTQIPVLLFPGTVLQVNEEADALLLLSVISGRNPDLLIGRHVAAAPLIRRSGLEVISTGYMLIESGQLTAAAYMSNTIPIPRGKNEIAACTALAGEQLGLKMIYLEAGSGAEKPVTAKMIRAVRKAVNIPLIVGGGICTPEKVTENCEAGADIIVVGNLFETHPEMLGEMAGAVHQFNHAAL